MIRFVFAEFTSSFSGIWRLEFRICWLLWWGYHQRFGQSKHGSTCWPCWPILWVQ